MIREAIRDRQLGVEKDFRWRGTEISRIEGLSDGVFAFAVTLLIVALEVPKTFDELLVAIRDFVPFALCFGSLMLVWFYQYRYFRRFGLSDGRVVVLNLILLFMMLFYVYPLKFVFTLAFDQTFDIKPDLPYGKEAIQPSDLPALFSIYGLGFAAVNIIFVILYWYALRHRDILALNPLEAILTRSSMHAYFVNAMLGLLSVATALLIGALFASSNAALAGWVYLLAPFVQGARRRYLRKAEQQARAALVEPEKREVAPEIHLPEPEIHPDVPNPTPKSEPVEAEKKADVIVS